MSAYPFSNLRLWASSVQNPAFATRFMQLIENEPTAFDNIWLGALLGLPDLEQHRHMAEINALFAKKIRNFGLGVSLQIPESIGHRGCGIDSYAACDWEFMVGADGVACDYVSCPRSSKFIEYERKMIALYASAIKPDYIWIDDDWRMDNHGSIKYGCFCQNCLAEFARRYGKRYSREQLNNILFKNDSPSETRLAWIEFNQDTLAEGARAISEAAHAACPGVRMGLQGSHTWTMYNGVSPRKILSAMSEATGLGSGLRPGAGTYTDYDPRWLIDKAFILGGTANNARAVAPTDMICAEIENYPRTALGKTSYGTVLEGALDLALGCDSLSYVLNVHQENSFEFDLSYFHRIANWKPFFKKLVPEQKLDVGGLNYVRSLRHPANAPGKNWHELSFQEGAELLYHGIPVYMNDAKTGKSPSLLTAEAARGFDQSDFEKIVIEGNVLMSGEAFFVLQQKGLTRALNIIASPLPADAQCGEILSHHAFNGQDAGNFYYMPQTIAPAFVFELGDPIAQPLGYAQRHLQKKRFGCTAFMLEHHNGQRLAVCGLPGRFCREISEAKQRQLVKLANWISAGQSTVLPRTSHAQVLIPLLHKRNLYGVVVLNSSIEPISFSLELCNWTGSQKTIDWIQPEKETRKIILEKATQTGKCQFTLPELPGWGIGFVQVMECGIDTPQDTETVAMS